MDVKGASGRILVFWDKRVLELIERKVGLFSVSCLFRNCANGFKWMFYGVYGTIVDSRRELFWEELGSIRGLWDGPWCGRGDFKTIRFPEERKSGGGISTSMRRMSYVIDDMRIRDIPIQRGPFTWRGGRNNCLMFRLDCFLYQMIGRLTSAAWFSPPCPDLFQIIAIFYWMLVVLGQVQAIFNLKLCGLELRVSRNC